MPPVPGLPMPVSGSPPKVEGLLLAHICDSRHDMSRKIQALFASLPHLKLLTSMGFPFCREAGPPLCQALYLTSVAFVSLS